MMRSRIATAFRVEKGRGLEARVLVDEIHVHRVHHGPEEPLHHVPQLDPLAVFRSSRQVTSGVSSPGTDQGIGRVFVWAALHHLPMDPGDVIVGGDGLEHAGLHSLAKAGPLAQVERGGDATNQSCRGGVAYALGNDVVGAPPRVLIGEHHHSPALGGHHGIVALVVGVRPPRTKTGQRCVNQFRVTVADSVIVNGQPLGYAGSEIFNDYVCKLCQPTGSFLSVRGFQV